jgi:hypothetical protein
MATIHIKGRLFGEMIDIDISSVSIDHIIELKERMLLKQVETYNKVLENNKDLETLLLDIDNPMLDTLVEKLSLKE